MKQIVHKPVIPLYASGATWLLYALLFPLYRLPHFLLAASAAAVVGIVARIFCPSTVEEVPEKPETIPPSRPHSGRGRAAAARAEVRKSGTRPDFLGEFNAAHCGAPALPVPTLLEYGRG